MKQKNQFTSILLIVLFLMGNLAIAQSTKKEKDPKEGPQIDTRIDNWRYWEKAAKEGIIPFNKDIQPKEATYTLSRIKSRSVITEDSPDVPVTTENSTQSENSIFVNPNDDDAALNSNNSTTNPVGSLYGADGLTTLDMGETWGGSIQGTGGSNSGDPAAVISNNGRYFNGYISSNYGQGVAYSDNQGATWTHVQAAPYPGGILDKNHLWIDNSTSSPYEGNLYDAYTPFGGSNSDNIELVYSNNNGMSYSSGINISSDVNAGSHDQGVNISTGPNGEVYAVWAIYDGWPTDETAIGFNKSYDGGASWEGGERIITNIRGVRTTETSKNMRVNSFPVMDVDLQNGHMYVVWANIGVPGVNQGPDIDVYMIKSTDEGETWSSPVRVNQDPTGLGNEHYFPWVSVDPTTGIVSVIFYDDRNVSSSEAEVFVANSFDGGETWEDFKVSDVSFTPSPIPGLAGGYFGDYLGIDSYGGKVYPVWTDNRTGTAMTYVSPFVTNNLPRPENLVIDLDDETGETTLSWDFENVPGFLRFRIYRDDIMIDSTETATYIDQLPDYGLYEYEVTAVHEGGESVGVSGEIQWGDADIAVNPTSFEEIININETMTKLLTVSNEGELDLDYNINTEIINKKGSNPKAYCDASGGCDEHISYLELGDIANSSGCDGYADYTYLSTTMNTGETYELTVTNGNVWSIDICGVWIDWNQNEDFTDDEPVNVTGGPEEWYANITPPMDAVPGTTRMRVRVQYGGTLNPCGSTSWGEVEDYSINVLSWLSIDPTAGIIPAGSSDDINVTFDANDIEVGQYMANIHVNSNDPDEPNVVVPVTLDVVDNSFVVTTTANPEEGGIVSGGGYYQPGEEACLMAEANLGYFFVNWTEDGNIVSTDPQYCFTVNDNHDFVANFEEAVTHFDFEGGNPADPVYTIYLSGASIDGENMVPGDEIAIFDGSTMVGAFTLEQVCTPDNQFENTLIAFSTVVSGNGYDAGNDLILKAWDVSEQMEYSSFTIEFANPYGDAWTEPYFPDGDGQYSLSNVMFAGGATQQMSLESGYQFTSTHILPSNPDLMVLLEDLMTDETLDFVRNTNGSMLQKIGPNWVNNIGDWMTLQGYLFKMNAGDDFMMEGNSIDPQTPIDLNTGYQFISYLLDYELNAIDAFGTILNDNLEFVRNSNGSMLQKIGPNWVNNIGNLIPGEGYLVKMNADDELIYPVTKSASVPVAKAQPDHFTFQGGNAADPVWTVFIQNANLEAVNLESGDEIAIYDGNKMVGSTIIERNLATSNSYQHAIPVFSTLDDGEGYQAGSDFTIRMWDASEETEFTGLEARFKNPYGDAWVETTFPSGDGNYSLVSLTKGSSKIGGSLGIESTSLISNYPNPYAGQTTIEYQLAQTGNVYLNVYNAQGQLVRGLVKEYQTAGFYKIEFDGSSLPEGVYQYTLKVLGRNHEFQGSKSMIIAR